MAATDADDWTTITELKNDSSAPSHGKNQPCVVCCDLNSYIQLIDPAELVRSAETKTCIGCMLILDALAKFDVDVSSLKFSHDFPAPEPSLSVSGQRSCKLSAGDLDLEIYASDGQYTPGSGPSPVSNVD